MALSSCYSERQHAYSLKLLHSFDTRDLVVPPIGFNVYFEIDSNWLHTSYLILDTKKISSVALIQKSDETLVPWKICTRYIRNEISYSPLQWLVKRQQQFTTGYNHKVSVMYVYSMEVVSLISLTPPGLYGDTVWKTLLGWYLLERSMPGIKGNQCKISYNSLSDSGCTEILEFTRMDTR